MISPNFLKVRLRELFVKILFRFFLRDNLPEDAEGFDVGCGSGRWAKLVAPRVGRLHCIDPSVALDSAKKIWVNFRIVLFIELR